MHKECVLKNWYALLHCGDFSIVADARFRLYISFYKRLKMYSSNFVIDEGLVLCPIFPGLVVLLLE